MEQMNREDRVTFELVERIPLEELSSDISVIRNVEVIPEIEMIAEYSSYRIRGALVFQGEYEARKQGETNHPLLLDRSANYNKRLVRKINHRIPVDISLPAERIHDDGVVMEITSLDYDLAEPNVLVVTTEVELQGVMKEEPIKNAHWDQAIQYDFVARDLDAERAKEQDQFRSQLEYQEISQQEQLEQNHDAKQEEQFTEIPSDQFESESVVAEPVKNTQDTQNEAQIEIQNVASDQKEEATFPEVERKNDVQAEQEALSLFEQANEVRTEETKEVESNDEQEAELNAGIEHREDEVEISVLAKVDEPQQELKVTISNKERKVSDQDFSNTKEDRKRTESISEDEKKKSRETTVGLLSKFLKNKEEKMSQIQICLVQPGETIAEIAQRYNVREDEILSINKLSFTSNISGKVLKIPVHRSR